MSATEQTAVDGAITSLPVRIALDNRDRTGAQYTSASFLERSVSKSQHSSKVTFWRNGLDRTSRTLIGSIAPLISAGELQNLKNDVSHFSALGQWQALPIL